LGAKSNAVAQHLAVDFASFLRLLKSRTQISQSSPAETSLVVPSVPTTTTRHRTASMWPLKFSTGPCRGEMLTSASKWDFLQYGKLVSNTYLKHSGIEQEYLAIFASSVKFLPVPAHAKEWSPLIGVCALSARWLFRARLNPHTTTLTRARFLHVDLRNTCSVDEVDFDVRSSHINRRPSCPTLPTVLRCTGLYATSQTGAQ
jgi:hypothetical protein